MIAWLSRLVVRQDPYDISGYVRLTRPQLEEVAGIAGADYVEALHAWASNDFERWLAVKLERDIVADPLVGKS